MRKRNSSRSRVAVAVIASSMLLAGCGSTGGSENNKDNGNQSMSKAEIYKAGLVGNQKDGGTPKDGGTLTIADYSEARSLDPTKTIPNGAAGGNALAAVYDVLMRYDQKSGKFEPRMAESLESSDKKTWTLKLRKGVTFSDGTPLTAASVAGSIGYYMKNRGFNTLLLATNIAGMKPVDATTLEITLNRPWATFPNMLSNGPGMVLAPAAYANPAKFNPIGAGPYILEDYKAGEEMVLKARPDYWKGKPHLDKLRFIWLSSDDARLAAVTDGSADVANIRAPQTVEKARKDGLPGFVTPNGLGTMFQINNREGRPGADIRVRQAINYAIDPEVYFERVSGGAGQPSRNIYSASAPYFEKVKTADADQAKAKELLKAAMADGYNGEINFLGQADPASQTAASTVQAMLEAVGFKVKKEALRSIAEQTSRIYVDHNFDMVVAAMSIPDEDPFSRLSSGLMSQSPQNAPGYVNPEMDKLISALQEADSLDKQKVLLKQINELWQETIPAIAMASGAFFSPWSEKVHGIQSNSENLMLFSDAWKS